MGMFMVERGINMKFNEIKIVIDERCPKDIIKLDLGYGEFFMIKNLQVLYDNYPFAIPEGSD